MSAAQPQRKKLIEVALPLDEINAACKTDKDRKTGTLRNLHKWFAPMPLPAWRALLFAALVDDPADDEQRAYLLDVIKRLVANGADLPDEATVREAREIIVRQHPEGLPTIFDPFCGGGSTLVEAQRLGLPTFGSDLNPVPALITRALTELLPKVHGRQPLHPEALASVLKKSGRGRASAPDTIAFLPADVGPRVYSGYDGLMRDVWRYAEVIRDQALNAIGAHYPISAGETPIAYLWARTATCPNPACGIRTALATSWWLSKRKSQLAWIEPQVEAGVVTFRIRQGLMHGSPPAPPKVGDGVFACLACRATLDPKYLRVEGLGGRIGTMLTCVVSEGPHGRAYRAATEEDVEAALLAPSNDSVADLNINTSGQGIRVGLYGIDKWRMIFTSRQMLALTTFAELTRAVHAQIQADGGTAEWADAVTTMLALAVGKLALFGSTQNRWSIDPRSGGGKAVGVFGMPTLPMTWDFAEVFPFGSGAGSWMQCVSLLAGATSYVVPNGVGATSTGDARTQKLPTPGLVATDPPYFEAIGYADLSDYFYIWHRHALRSVHPDLYGTIATPKGGELIASPSRHEGSPEAARRYFISGFTETFRNLQVSTAPDLPMLVVYASKEQKSGAGEETRWASILTSIVDADLEITGTWPIHGTGTSRMRGVGSNAVATYVAMVCRPRPASAASCSLADFNRALRRELRPAIHNFQAAGILPVDLAQAARGPGMQTYSRYRQVVDQAGRRVPVEHALRLINAALGEVLDEQEGELDLYSRFAVAWWEKHGWTAAPFGEADQLARPQGTSVDDLVRAGVTRYPRPGFVELLGVGMLDRTWRPAADSHPTAWEAVHHLADRLIDGGGSKEAGRLIGDLGTLRDPAQALVYRLHDIAAKRGWTKDQERYNALIGSWSDLLAVSVVKKDGLF